MSVPSGLATGGDRAPLRWLAWCAALAAALVCWIAVVAGYDLWWAIGVPTYPPHFLDWLGVVAASDCAKVGFNVYVVNPCDPYHRLHNYFSLWLRVGDLGLTRDNAWWTGFTISAGFIVSAVAALRPKSLADFLVVLVAMASPAIMLGVERANVDLILCMVLIAAAVLMSRPDAIAKSAGALLCLAMTVAKFYPAVAFVSILWVLPSRRAFLLAMTGFAASVAAWALLDINEIETVINIFEKPGLGATNGASLLFVTLAAQHLVSPSLDPVQAGWITFVAAYLLSLFLAPSLAWTDRTSPLERVWFIAGSAISVFTFAVTTNYDYRDVFLLLTLPFLLRFARDTRQERRLTRSVAVMAVPLLVLVFWASGALVWIQIAVRWAGGGSGTVRSVTLAGLLAKHLANWVLVFALMLIGNSLLLRRWAELTTELPKPQPGR